MEAETFFTPKTMDPASLRNKLPDKPAAAELEHRFAKVLVSNINNIHSLELILVSNYICNLF